MGQDIDRLPASRGEVTDAPGGEGATALIAQLFRQVLRLQPRNERSMRPPLRDADQDAARDAARDEAWRTDPLAAPAQPPPQPPPSLVPGAGIAKSGPQVQQRQRDGTKVAADKRVTATSGINDRAASHTRMPPVQAAQALPDQAGDHPAGDALQRLASDLQRLCERGAQVSQHWSATLQLDPHALPETQLRVQASRSWMRLRFSTQSADSVRLISEHAPALCRSLEESLDMKDQVDIDFE